jgi:type IV secretion system protein VirB2
LGDAIAKNALKGDQLIVQAQIRANNWTDRDGEKQYDHSFVVQGFRFGAPGRAKREELAARRDERTPSGRWKPKSNGARRSFRFLTDQPGKGFPSCSRRSFARAAAGIPVTCSGVAAFWSSAFRCFAWAQASPFMTGATALQTNILAWLTPVAIILVMVLGGMAMANRISWGWCLGAILGIAIAFGAPQIVTWVRGMFGV